MPGPIVGILGILDVFSVLGVVFRIFGFHLVLVLVLALDRGRGRVAAGNIDVLHRLLGRAGRRSGGRRVANLDRDDLRRAKRLLDLEVRWAKLAGRPGSTRAEKPEVCTHRKRAGNEDHRDPSGDRDRCLAFHAAPFFRVMHGTPRR